MSLKSLNLKRAQKELAEWKKQDRKDKRIAEFQNYISTVQKQIKSGEYNVEYAKTYIKDGYKESLINKKNSCLVPGN